MHEQKETIIPEMENIKNKKVEILEMESMVRVMKNIFNEPISRLKHNNGMSQQT